MKIFTRDENAGATIISTIYHDFLDCWARQKRLAKAEYRHLGTFQPSQNREVFCASYQIVRGYFKLQSPIVVNEPTVNLSLKESVQLVENQIIRRCELFEAEWSAYWQGNLWC